MMYIHGEIRIRIQNIAAQLSGQLHGIHRIILAGTAHLYLEGLILIRVHVVHVGYNVFGQFLIALVLQKDNRTDTHDTEYGL